MVDRSYPPYERLVFINCPFDDRYKPIFDTIVFTILICGFIPRCALEITDSVAIRLEKIVSIIKECKLGIHDISQVETDLVNNLPRFNMPLELGLFLGASRFGGRQQRQKRCMVMDVEQYRYQKFMSDIAGQDIQLRGQHPSDVIEPIRNFLRTATEDPLPGSQALTDSHAQFEKDLPNILESAHLSVSDVTYVDLVYIVTRWLRESYTLSRK